MIMNMVVFVCLICTCSLMPKKFIWVKQLLDPGYYSFWKILEMSVLENFHSDWTILFRTVAPDCVLNTLSKLSAY